MTELQMLTHLLDRPGLYLPRKTVDCLIAYLWGLAAAQQGRIPKPLVTGLLEATRLQFVGESGETSRNTAELVREKFHGDEERSFHELVAALKTALESPLRR